MTPCVRPPCPQWLEEHWREWGEEYAAKLADDPRHQFAWKTWEGVRVNRHILPLLNEMTLGHCAYCDWFPMDTGTDPTIDHFRPKARFPLESYHWPNLYLCCRHCQEKDDRAFTDGLLRPDEDGYTFERYFIYNHRDGTIAANPAASPEDLHRAEVTIAVFKLNSRGRPAARQRELQRFRDIQESERARWIPDSPFRYLLVDAFG